MANPSSRVFPDSSFWVSYFWDEDGNHGAAVRLAKEAGLLESRVFFNHYSLGEAITILTYRGGRGLADAFLTALGALDAQFVDAGVEAYLRAFGGIPKKVAFSDVAIVLDAVRYGAELLSFDKQQISIYKALLPSR